MGLARYIAPVNGRTLVWHWLAVCSIFAWVSLPPLAVALAAEEYAVAAAFAGLATSSFALGRIRTRFAGGVLELRDALVVTALAYLTFALFGAVPLLLGLPPLDALFESMSGFTTTGLTMATPEELPSSLLFFRAYSQWIGGAGIIILSLAIVFGTGRTSRQLFASEYGDGDIVGSVRATARIVVWIYGGLTVLAWGVLLASGSGWRDAALHALASVSTGGFSPHSASAGAYAGTWPRLAFLPAMLLGATTFTLFYRARRDGVRVLVRDAQVRALVAIVALGAVLIWASGRGAGQSAADALFHAGAAVTTTGFAVSDPSEWPASTSAIVIVLMILGGCGGSTAGGIKLRRVLLLLGSARLLLMRASLPREAVAPLRLGGDEVPAREESMLLSFVTLYLCVLLASTALFVLAGYAPGTSLFESASALGTVGLSAGPTCPELAPGLKLVLIFDMWAGRLEILPVLLVVSVRTWRAAGGES